MSSFSEFPLIVSVLQNGSNYIQNLLKLAFLCFYKNREPSLEIELWMLTCELCFPFTLDCTTKGIRSVSTAEDFV